MATNNPSSTVDTTSENQSNNVSLRIVALAHSTNENEDLYLVTSLDTSIIQLKEKLRENLSQRPDPASQRLIYQGRPLTDGNAVLRNILRLEAIGGDAPSVHVLHLVIRNAQEGIPPPRQQEPTTETSTDGPPTSHGQIAAPGSSLPPGLNFIQQALPIGGLAANASMHEIMQQHMANVQAIHQQHLQAHHNHQHIQTQQRSQAQEEQPQNHHPHQTHPHQTHPHQTHPHQTHPHQTHPHQAHPHQNTQIPLFNGHQPPFIVPNLGLPPAIAQSLPITPSLSQDPAHIAGRSVVHGSYSMSVQERRGPNGEIIRTVVHNGPRVPSHVTPAVQSTSLPNSALQSPGIPQQLPSHPHSPFSFPSIPNLPGPALAHPHHHVHPFQARSAVQSPAIGLQAQSPTLYLLSSPTGPEALLITPNHGAFSSTQQTYNAPQVAPHVDNNVGEGASTVQQSLPVQVAQQDRGLRQNEQAQIALRPQQALPGNVPAQVPPGRREGEDLIALGLQRGWLFLRLYMFIFVLSEPSTWRRYVLLILASLVCLLPRNNPFTVLFQAARRHFDNLIGPPQPAALVNRPPNNGPRVTRDGANQNPVTSAPGTSSNSPQNAIPNTMPTPEQNARRLIHEHQQRNPDVFREVLRRIEQGVVLFLASLIPGVGERHVRAREEARRIEQEEEQRRRHEDEVNTQQQSEGDNHAKTDGTTASAHSASTEHDHSSAMTTGNDPTAGAQSSSLTSGGGLRMRDTGSHRPATST